MANRPEAAMVGVSQLAGVRWAQGRGDGDLTNALSGLTTALPQFDALRALETMAVYLSGDHDRAHHLFDTACADGSIANLDHNQLYLAALVNWSELAVAFNDRNACTELATRLEPYANQFVFTGSCVYGPAAHALGLLARASGDEDGASKQFAHAVDVAGAMPSSFFVSRASAHL
jgi:hypothetical protein